MKKQLFLSFLCLIFVISCSDKNKQDYYGQCSEGDRRCSGDKLEKCSSYSEWTLDTECDQFGGECISNGNNSYCSEIPDSFDSDTLITDWGEEEEDDAGDTLTDNSIWPDLGNEDEDIIDEDMADSDFDKDIEDSDITDEDVVIAECGNTIVEEGEVCEKGTLKDCIDIDAEKYSGGKAFCFDDCSGYNVLTCDEIEIGDSD